MQHTDTMIDAGNSVEKDLGRLQQMVLDHVRGRYDYGSTCDEAEKALSLPHQTCSARFNDLHKSGWVRDSGLRRLTRSRRKAIVWVAV